MDLALMTSLNCRHAQDVPAEFPEGLIALDLSFNKLSVIPRLEGIKRLQRLDLSNNHLTSIESLSGCYSLTELSLASNMLRTIDNLRHLSELTRLNLESNLIQTPADIRPLSFNCKLKVLILQGNPVASLKSYKPTIHSVIPGLQMLDNKRRARLNATFTRETQAFFTHSIETVSMPVRSPPIKPVQSEAKVHEPVPFKPRSQAELGRVKRTLRSIYYFSDLSADQITALLQCFFIISFQVNETLIVGQSTCECLIVVLSGELLYSGKRLSADAKLFVEGLFVPQEAEGDLTCLQAGEAILLTRETFEGAEASCRGLVEMVKAFHARANIIPAKIKENQTLKLRLAKTVSERLHNLGRKPPVQPVQFSFSPNISRSPQSAYSARSMKKSAILTESVPSSHESESVFAYKKERKVETTYRPKTPALESFEFAEMSSFSPKTPVHSAECDELNDEITTCKSTLCSLIVLSQDLESVTKKQTDSYRNILTECDLFAQRPMPDLVDASKPALLKELIVLSNAIKLHLQTFLEALERKDLGEIVRQRFELIRSRMVPIEKLPLSLQRIADFADSFLAGRAEIDRATQPVGDLSFTSSQSIDT
jgi:hypothetical protein